MASGRESAKHTGIVCVQLGWEVSIASHLKKMFLLRICCPHITTYAASSLRLADILLFTEKTL